MCFLLVRFRLSILDKDSIDMTQGPFSALYQEAYSVCLSYYYGDNFDLLVKELIGRFPH